MSKKSWERPLLTVLLRSQPEESVLLECKSQNLPAGPGNTNFECSQAAAQPCQNCQGQNSKS